MSENTDTTGGTRFSSGKPNAVGTPIMGLMEVFRVVERGADKYALLDWEVGQSFKTLLNSGFRHYAACLNDPLARDSESGLLHAAHAAWNLLCLLHFVEVGRADEMDDITKWRGVTTAMKREMERTEAEKRTAAYKEGYERGFSDAEDPDGVREAEERIMDMLAPEPNPGMDGDRPMEEDVASGWSLPTPPPPCGRVTTRFGGLAICRLPKDHESWHHDDDKQVVWSDSTQSTS